MKQCAVPNCCNNSENSRALFFNMPRTESVRANWIANIKNLELKSMPWTTQKNHVVCSDHFETAQFQTASRQKLLRGAIPTLFEWNIQIPVEIDPPSTLEESQMSAPSTSNALPRTPVKRKLVYDDEIHLPKVLKRDCQTCVEFLLSDKCTDSHALILLKDYGDADKKLLYPKESFVKYVTSTKNFVFRMIPKIINKGNILEALCQVEDTIDVNCPHNMDLNKNIATVISAITLKYFITQVNRKLRNKDVPANVIIDNYIKMFGPKSYLRK